MPSSPTSLGDTWQVRDEGEHPRTAPQLDGCAPLHTARGCHVAPYTLADPCPRSCHAHPIAIPGTPFGAISLCSQPLKEIFDNNNEMLDLLAESYVTAAAQGRPGESLCDEIVARAVYLVRNVVRQGRFLEFLVSLCAVDGRGVRPIQWCVLPPNLPWWSRCASLQTCRGGPDVPPSKLAVVVRVCPPQPLPLVTRVTGASRSASSTPRPSSSIASRCGPIPVAASRPSTSPQTPSTLPPSGAREERRSLSYTIGTPSPAEPAPSPAELEPSPANCTLAYTATCHSHSRSPGLSLARCSGL